MLTVAMVSLLPSAQPFPRKRACSVRDMRTFSPPLLEARGGTRTGWTDADSLLWGVSPCLSARVLARI